MGLGREVHHRLRPPFEGRGHVPLVAYISFDKRVPGIVLYLAQVFRIAGIGQFVQVPDFVILVFGYNLPDEIAADETASSGYEQAHEPLSTPY
jgi:hypothetical protein